MTKDNNFDVVLYEKGDILVPKFRFKDDSTKTVESVENVEEFDKRGNPLIYQIITFTDGSFDTSHNWEPADEEQRRRYRELLSEVIDKTGKRKKRVKSKKKAVKEKAREKLTFDMNQIKKKKE